MKSAELKNTLEQFDKKDLIKLVLDLAKLQKDNMAWLDTKLQGSKHISESVEYYKKKILSSFEGRINLKVAKKAISDFRKASNDRESLIDLMLLYVESGTEITIKYGDMYEQFYYSLECMYGDTVELLNKWGDKNLIEKFRPRLKAVVTKTEGMGWGYHDTLNGIYYDELGEE
jgi:hypothetical protein